MKMRRFGSLVLIAALTATISFGCAPQPAPAHIHVLTAWETDRAASCTEAGESVRRCEDCEYEERKPIPATGHSLGETVETLAPTCTEKGTSVRRCGVCDFKEETTIPALGHEWKNETVLRQATCTEAGEKRTDECIRCGAGGETLPIPATGHSWGEETIRTPATCTTQGLSVVKCKTCGAEETKPIPQKEHDWGELQTDVNGQFRRCNVCGARDAMGNELLYTIDVVTETGCNFVMSEKNQVLIYRDSMLILILEANIHTEVMLSRGTYLVRLDNVDDAYLSGQVAMTADKPFTEIKVRNNPEHDPEIHPVKQGDKMFNFLVKDTFKEAGEYERLYNVAAGKKLIYIDFFYVACSPCEAILKEHVKFYETLSEEVKKDLLVILVDTTTGDSPEYINDYRKKHNVPNEFISVAKGGRIYNNVPNERKVPHAVYLDGDFNLVRIGGASALADMIEKYIPTKS